MWTTDIYGCATFGDGFICSSAFCDGVDIKGICIGDGVDIYKYNGAFLLKVTECELNRTTCDVMRFLKQPVLVGDAQSIAPIPSF